MRSRIKPNGNISAPHEWSVICGPIGCAVDFVCRLLHLKIISLKKPLQIGLCNKATINWKATSPVRLKTSANNQIKFNSKGFYVANFSEIELCQKTRPSPSIKIILDKFGKVEKVEAGACSS